MARILIVDDEPDIRAVLAGFLELEGHEVVEASSGVEAVQCLDDVDPALIISDVMMPEMNGFELLDRLQPRIADRIPFVIVSSHDEPDGVQAALFAGAFDYLFKPFDPAQVREVVGRALGARCR